MTERAAAAAVALLMLLREAPSVLAAVGFDPPLPEGMRAELRIRSRGAPAGTPATLTRPLLSLEEYRARGSPEGAARRLVPAEPPPYASHSRYVCQTTTVDAAEAGRYSGTVAVHGLAIGPATAAREVWLALLC